MSYHILDARRLLCPLPVIRTQDQAATLSTGDVLEVMCTDPGVMNDIPAWCRINGHTIKEIKQNNGDIVITIEINGD